MKVEIYIIVLMGRGKKVLKSNVSGFIKDFFFIVIGEIDFRELIGKIRKGFKVTIIRLFVMKVEIYFIVLMGRSKKVLKSNVSGFIKDFFFYCDRGGRF